MIDEDYLPRFSLLGAIDKRSN